MVVISKLLFESNVGPEVTCTAVIHPWTKNCLKANLLLSLKHFGPGVFYFYVPIYLIKLLSDYKNIDKNYIKKFLKSYLRTEMFGFAFGALTLNTICLGNKVLGRVGYYSVGLLTGFVAGASLIIEEKQNRILNSVLWVSLVVEAAFKNLYFFNIIKYSPMRETLIFMLTSSLLMHLLANRTQKKLPPNLWFYIPSTKKSPFDRKKYLFEILKYFGIGYGLSISRTVIFGIANLRKRSVQSFVKSLFNKQSFNFGMVLGMYVALYNASTQILRKLGSKTTKNAAIAGLIAGMSYYIKPANNILAIAIVTTLQMLSEEFLTFHKISKIPISVLIYMVCNGILFHSRIAALDVCPKYYYNLLNIASRGLVDRVYSTVINNYFS